MKSSTIDTDGLILARPLRQVMELNELGKGDLILIVSNFSPEGEEDARNWQTEVTNVQSCSVESGLHFKGPILTMRTCTHPEDHTYADVMNPDDPANGTFVSGGAFWLTQIYLLLSAKELEKREKI